MAKKNFCFVMLAMALAFGMTAEIHAQSTNHVPRLVGTWISTEDGSVVVFNQNGTGAWGSGNFRYGAIEDKIAVTYFNGFSTLYEFVSSSDGRTLILWSMRDGYNIAWVLQRRD